jgi:hypothetical protein
LEPAQTDRISGAAEVLARLGSKEQGIMPTLFVFNRCRRLIECLPRMQHDPHRPEDVLKVNADPETGEGGDDEYDTAGTMSMILCAMASWRSNVRYTSRRGRPDMYSYCFVNERPVLWTWRRFLEKTEIDDGGGLEFYRN